MTQSVSRDLELLAAEVTAETQRIWLNEPEEVRKLRLGLVETGAGSKGQYFTTLVFANGEVRALGYLSLTTLEICAKDSEFDLPQLRKVAKSLLAVSGEYLGYSGFDKIWNYLSRLLALINEAESKAGFAEAISALRLYVNRMNGWVHFYFPWAVGGALRQLTPEDLCDLVAASAQTDGGTAAARR
jgi:hypothetical protein